MSPGSPSHWRDHGVKIIPSTELDLNTPQTPGMTRAAAITHARTGASKLWAGTVTVEANAKTGAVAAAGVSGEVDVGRVCPSKPHPLSPSP